MEEEQDMENVMKETEQKYQRRMEQQLRLKEEMLQKLEEDRKMLEDRFKEFIDVEKEQLDVLEDYAKNNMGKKKFAIVDENVRLGIFQKEFKSKAYQYGH